MGSSDRQESSADIDHAIRILASAQRLYRDLPELDRPMRGSILHVEGLATAYEPIHSLVTSHYVRGLDNLHMFFTTADAENANVMAYPYAMYSLLRTTLEAGATAYWLIENNRKPPRILRALQLSFRNGQERAQVAVALGAPNDVGERVIERLND